MAWGKIRLEIAPQDVEHLKQHGVAQRIKNLIPFFAVHDDLSASQHRQMLRKVGLLDADPLLDGSG